jgi:hypothetical protein
MWNKRSPLGGMACSSGIRDSEIKLRSHSARRQSDGTLALSNSRTIHIVKPLKSSFTAPGESPPGRSHLPANPQQGIGDHICPPTHSRG